MLRIGSVLLVVLTVLAWGSEAKAQAMTTSVKVQLKKVPMKLVPPVFGVAQNTNWAGGNYTYTLNNLTYLPLTNDYYMEATIWILQNGMSVKGGSSGWIAVPK